MRVPAKILLPDETLVTIIGTGGRRGTASRSALAVGRRTRSGGMQRVGLLQLVRVIQAQLAHRHCAAVAPQAPDAPEAETAEPNVQVRRGVVGELRLRPARLVEVADCLP